MAFEWLDGLMEKVFSVFPRVHIVTSTESGVAYWFGRPRLIKSETIYVSFPLVCHVDIRTSCKQCIDCTTQAVITKDGRSVAIGVVVQYRVVDPLRAFRDFDDMDTYIPPLAMSVAAESVRGHTRDEIQGGIDLADGLTKSLRSKLRNSGVDVINVFVNEVVPCRVIRLIGNPSYVSDGSE